MRVHPSFQKPPTDLVRQPKFSLSNSHSAMLPSYPSTDVPNERMVGKATRCSAWARPISPRDMADPRASCVVIQGAVVSCEKPVSLQSLHCASKWPLDATTCHHSEEQDLHAPAGRATPRLFSCAPVEASIISYRAAAAPVAQCLTRTLVAGDIKMAGAPRFGMGAVSPSSVRVEIPIAWATGASSQYWFRGM